MSTRTPEYQAFIARLALLTKDQECAECGSDADANRNCPDHHLWTMSGDDAYDTLHSLISEARRLIANRFPQGAV